MKVSIKKLNNPEYTYWIKQSSIQQAKDRVSVNGNDLEQELKTVEDTLPSILPKGKETSGHNFYNISYNDIKDVGFIWIGVLPNLPENSCFLFDIMIRSQFRSKGIGREALTKVHSKIKEEGYSHILLNVLKSNYAKNLYTSLGYQTIEDYDNSLIMMKSL